MALVRVMPHMYLFTPLGVAEAHFLESFENFEVDSVWTCFQTETKEAWQWPNPLVRICESISGMRNGSHTGFKIEPDYLEVLRPHILRHKSSPLYGLVTGED
jgi:hypothetical protein